MDAAAALAGLQELSSQVIAAVVLGPDGTLEAGAPSQQRAERLAGTARELVQAAAEVRPSAGSPSRIEVSLPDGSVFVVREGTRSIAAVTTPEPTAGLVVYDLRAALRSIDDQPARKPRARARKPADA